MTLDRRQFISSTAALAASASLPGCSALDFRSSRNVVHETLEERMERLFLLELEPAVGTTRGPGDARNLPKWTKLPPDLKELYRPTWVTTNQTINYDHLDMGVTSLTFWIDDAIMKLLCTLNTFTPEHFDLKKASIREKDGRHQVSDYVLFGIRGCRITRYSRKSHGWQGHIGLAESEPDHISPECVIGVWNRKKKSVWATRASTVPNADYMYGQMKNSWQKAYCNMLPTGMYDYVVGTHRGKYGGSFRHASFTPVVRTTNDMEYGPSDKWDTRQRNAADNIHASLSEHGELKFASAGCQTIPGNYDDHGEKVRNRPNGQWNEFRKFAGLSSKVSTRDDGKVFKYILLTGRDVYQAGTVWNRGKIDRDLVRMRFGSSGKDVADLQSRMGLKADADFGPGTMRAILDRQKSQNIMDGIYRPWADLG